MSSWKKLPVFVRSASNRNHIEPTIAPFVTLVFCWWIIIVVSFYADIFCNIISFTVSLYMFLTFLAWLNNCVGHFNRRYFLMFMVYIVTGIIFLVVFGVEIAYQELWLNYNDVNEVPELYGYSVNVNTSLPKVCIFNNTGYSFIFKV